MLALPSSGAGYSSPSGVLQTPNFGCAGENKRKLAEMGAMLLLREIFRLFCPKHLPIYFTYENSFCKSELYGDLRIYRIFYRNIEYFELYSDFSTPCTTPRVWERPGRMSGLLPDPFPSHLSPSLPLYTPPRSSFLPSSFISPERRVLCSPPDQRRYI